MRWILLPALLVVLSACSGVLDWCPDGLSDAPAGSSIPKPHG